MFSNLDNSQKFFMAPFISLVLTCSDKEEKSNTNQP